jgi:hypothetical protein
MTPKFIPVHTSEITKKQQIVLFHNPVQFNSHYFIKNNGEIIKQFDDKLWCKHLDIDLKTFEKYGTHFRYLDKSIIGITLENYGPVEYRNKNFYLKWYYPDKPVEDAYEFCAKTKCRGHQHWELY